MSTSILAKTHIDAMLASAKAADVVVWEGTRYSFRIHRNVLGQALVDENYCSVTSYYGKPKAGEPYAYIARMTYPLEPVALLKALDCYEYNAGEAPGYEQTLAFAIVKTLRAIAISRLPGYEDAAWEIA